MDEESVDLEYQWQAFSGFSGDLAMAWLFLTIVPYDPLVAWGGSIGVGLVGDLAKWWVYPRTLWASVFFRLARSAALWFLALWAAWVLWGMGARGQAGVILATRILLNGFYGGLGGGLIDAPLAALMKAFVPKRLFWRRFLGVTDLQGPLEPIPGWFLRLLPLNVATVAAAVAWVYLMVWIGK